jgi:hypothetical protein
VTCSKLSRIVMSFVISTVWFDVHAQSSLPPCPTNTSVFWTNCYGALTLRGGDKYFGEFRDDRFHGQGSITNTYAKSKYVGEWNNGVRAGLGIEYNLDGTVRNSGRWSNGVLADSFTLDGNRFPFQGIKKFGDTSDSVGQLAAAEAKIRELQKVATEIEGLKRENERLRQRIDELQRKPDSSGIDTVERCLARGLRPGSVQFSECISNGR